MEIITNVQCVLFIMIKYKLALAVEQLTSRNNYLPSVTIGNKNRHPLRDGCLPWLAKAILSCFCKGNTNYLKSKRNLPVHVNPISIRSTATIGAKRPSPPHWGGFRRGWIKEPKAPVLFRAQKKVGGNPPTFFSARNRTRTCTALRPLVPETSVSTNFTIRADTSFFQRDCKDSAFFVYRKLFFEPGLKIHDAGQTCGDTDDAADVTNGSDIDP